MRSALDKKQRVWAIGTAIVRSDTGDTVGHYSAGSGKGSVAVCTFRLPKKHVKVTGKVTVIRHEDGDREELTAARQLPAPG